ncbi:glyoxalase [Actinopolyspora erythraea]|uniref:Glyoxalase n=1 Tax=Actinopolyspora erythraea TaxID=414996 RepID=A0A099D0R2_9ACTN|nr:VOC family protein [Actinopolyspora erythraea]ASU81207.1 glyoxalase [Actinopolyspora erythraea]KGI79417.1 glyoxalase [Actinopolyspora erythraea]
MGNPVVHFEILGRDAEKLRDYYSRLFGWKIDADNPLNYGIVERETVDADGEVVGIGGGIGAVPEPEQQGLVTFYVGVDDVERALSQAESLGGNRVMGPEKVMERIEIGMFADPEGHVVGVVRSEE